LPVDPIVVRRRLRALERYLRVLRQLRARGRDAFLRDEAVQDRAERNAELLAQVCADIALHIVSAAGTAAPETYGDALRLVAPIVELDAGVTDRLAAAARLRNILVHMYLDVDHGRLFDELGWIDDTETFAASVERWLGRQ
jgi:uncharacterized protein YutE (UPF0331/DUF86 family)